MSVKRKAERSAATFFEKHCRNRLLFFRLFFIIVQVGRLTDVFTSERRLFLCFFGQNNAEKALRKKSKNFFGKCKKIVDKPFGLW